jgi:hypothetical protein
MLNAAYSGPRANLAGLDLGQEKQTSSQEEMEMLSRDAKLVSGITVLIVPTIMYGGLALLGILTRGRVGAAPGPLSLDETQFALWRAGHAHAGVWTLLSLVVQILLDSARLSSALKWFARIGAPAAAVAVSAGFFGVAFSAAFRWLVYSGGVLLLIALVLTGVGLLRNARSSTSDA